MSQLPLVVVAPDAFKGSLSSREAARAIAAGVQDALGDRARVIQVPLADGGEGTLDALSAAWDGETRTVRVSDAAGRPRDARFALSADHRTAIIESAEANGLPLVADLPPSPRSATSFGVGELIAAALDAGARDLLVAVGGSATSDGGAGLLTALGARILDAAGDDVPPGAEGLSAAERLDLSGLDPRLAHTSVRVAVDVSHPLLAAATVFAPQKGAGARDVARIEEALRRWAGLLSAATGIPVSTVLEAPGGGAAGGLPVALTAGLGARVEPGADLVARVTGLDARLAEASLVLTGEGRLDDQSLRGKVLSRVLSGTPPATPVVSLAGSVELTPRQCRDAGLVAAFSIASGPASLAALQADAHGLLRNAAAHAASFFRTVSRD